MRDTTLELDQRAFWPAVEPAREPALRQWVNLGTLRLPRERISGCRIEDVVDRDRVARLATLALLLAAGLVLLLGLVEFDWRTRVLLGAGVLAIVGLVSAMELLGIGRAVHYRLEVQLADGRRIAYTTDSQREAEGLASEIGPLPPPLLDASE